MTQTKLRGVARVEWIFVFKLAAYNSFSNRLLSVFV